MAFQTVSCCSEFHNHSLENHGNTLLGVGGGVHKRRGVRIKLLLRGLQNIQPPPLLSEMHSGKQRGEGGGAGHVSLDSNLKSLEDVSFQSAPARDKANSSNDAFAVPKNALTALLRRADAEFGREFDGV